ncbi:tetratricopeptide repeat protein [uncultured Akkermansia sp.]|uniref:tetratricopeptide repeat protein n=1 Tax=uncultured Akkermansia sp. TaxID=512294 RepID=UPI00265CF033|nr:tetratricopeptide repeat protein [uncultured Akkermansia sp.]
MMHIFSSSRFPHAALISCSVLLLSLGTAAVEAAATSPPAPALSQDQQALLKNKKYQQGLKALEDQLPLEASKHFQECLSSKNIPESQKAIIRPFLAEALIRANKTEEGLKAWEQLPDSSMKSYWMAAGLFNKGSFTKALEKLSDIPETDPLFLYGCQLKAQLARQLQDRQLLLEALTRAGQAESPALSRTAQLLQADVLVDMARYPEAAAILERIKEGMNNKTAGNVPMRAYAELVEGRLADRQGNLDQAMKIFAAVMDNKAYPEKIRDLGRLALARTEIIREKNNPEQAEEETRAQTQEEEAPHTAGTAEERLLAFIGGKAESSLLMDAFNILLEEDIFRTNPQALEKLTGWVNARDAARQPAAMYAMGNLLLAKDDLAGALKMAEEGLSKYPQSLPVQALCLNTITALLDKNRVEDAERLISRYPGTTPNLIFQQGALAFRKGDYPLAQGLFREAACRASEKTAENALFNENLAALNANDAAGAAALVKQAAGSAQLREHILFEQAHYAAKRMLPQASELLAHFVAVAENPALKTQARLDQAEVALNLNPPDLATVQSVLPPLEKEQLSPDQTMQLAQLKIMEAESRQEWPNAIQACRQAISLDAEGKQADMLYLKLGELLYKNGDFHEAQLVLQPFPSKYPDSSLQAAALFLAGKAAQQSNTGNTLKAALNIFKTLGEGDTPFAQPARIEEASVLLRMGKADQCIAALENLLSTPLPRYMRLLALSIQADAWVTKEDTNSDTLRKAINLCTEILDTPNLGLAWKFKALTQRAQFYERMNDQKKALDDYASILAHTPSGNSANKRRDWHWFYNAGFASIRLLGQLQDWNGALALAKKLAQTSGPRAREAAAYARRIQLEHFIWQDEPEDASPESAKPETPAQTAR